MSGTRFRTFALMAAIATGIPALGCGDEEVTFQDPATITVRNLTNGRILRVFFKSCGAADWGFDRLPSDPVEGVINIGESRTFTVEAGCYDLRADHFSGPDPEPEPLPTVERFGVLVSAASPFTWDVEPEGTQEPA